MRRYLILMAIIGALITALYGLGKGYKDHAIAKQAKAPQPEFTFVRRVDSYLLYKHRTLNICLLAEPTHSGGKTQIDCSLTEEAE